MWKQGKYKHSKSHNIQYFYLKNTEDDSPVSINDSDWIHSKSFLSWEIYKDLYTGVLFILEVTKKITFIPRIDPTSVEF